MMVSDICIYDDDDESNENLGFDVDEDKEIQPVEEIGSQVDRLQYVTMYIYGNQRRCPKTVPQEVEQILTKSAPEISEDQKIALRELHLGRFRPVIG